MTKSRMTALAAVAAFSLLLIGGVGTAAAQTTGTSTPLTKVVKMTGTAKNGKKFNGTYTIQRFVQGSEGTVAVGTLKGKLKNRRVTRRNVRIPVALENHQGATTSQLPDPTPGACPVLDLVLEPIELNLLGLRVATSRIELLVEAIPGAGNLLGNLLCAITGILDPDANSPQGLLTRVLNALLALVPRTA